MAERAPLKWVVDAIDRPSDAAILERARSLATEAINTVALQRRRLRSTEPEDDVLAFRWWADLQFLIVALRRLRRTVHLGARIPAAADAMHDGLQSFDDALPLLAQMRNVGEHIDEYAVDAPRRHHKNVDRRQLQVGSFDGTAFRWLGGTLNIDDALTVGEALYRDGSPIPRGLSPETPCTRLAPSRMCCTLVTPLQMVDSYGTQE